MASGGLPVSGGVLGLPAVPKPPKYKVRLRTVDRKLDLTARLDDGEWKYTPQGQRLDTTDLPYREQATSWAGQTTATLEGYIILDGWPRTSVEYDVLELEAMALPAREGRASGAPRPVQIAGAVPGSYHLWQLVGIEYTKVHRYNGQRVRVHATLSFAKHEPPEDAETKKRRNARDSNGKLKKRPPYTVKRGDTLPKIAAAQLGDSSLWKQIAKLNPHVKGKKSTPRRKPDDVRTGEKLKLPQD